MTLSNTYGQSINLDKTICFFPPKQYPARIIYEGLTIDLYTKDQTSRNVQLFKQDSLSIVEYSKLSDNYFKDRRNLIETYSAALSLKDKEIGQLKNKNDKLEQVYKHSTELRKQLDIQIEDQDKVIQKLNKKYSYSKIMGWPNIGPLRLDVVLGAFIVYTVTKK